MPITPALIESILDTPSIDTKRELVVAAQEFGADGVRLLNKGNSPRDEAPVTLFELFRATQQGEITRQGILLGWLDTGEDAYSPEIVWEEVADYAAFKSA